MRVDYTSAVALALEKAQTCARAERAAQVMARHLLQGLLHEQEGRAWAVVTHAGVDPGRLREALPARGDVESGGPRPPLAGSGPISVSAEVEAMLREAAELGRLLSAEHTVSSDQVLLALLRGDAGLRGELEGL